MGRTHHVRGYATVLVLFLLVLAAAVVVDIVVLQRAPGRVPPSSPEVGSTVGPLATER